MAAVRTALTRKGRVQPQRGTAYESDIHSNLLALDSNVMYSADPVEVALAPTDVGTSPWPMDSTTSPMARGSA